MKIAAYVCPQCSIPYCSVECYKSERHAKCLARRYQQLEKKNTLNSNFNSKKENQSILQLSSFIESKVHSNYSKEFKEDLNGSDCLDNSGSLDKESIDMINKATPLQLLSLLSKDEKSDFLKNMNPQQISDFVFDSHIPWFKSNSSLEEEKSNNLIEIIDDSKKLTEKSKDKTLSLGTIEGTRFNLFSIKAPSSLSCLALSHLPIVFFIYSYIERVKSASEFLFFNSNTEDISSSDYKIIEYLVSLYSLSTFLLDRIDDKFSITKEIFRLKIQDLTAFITSESWSEPKHAEDRIKLVIVVITYLFKIKFAMMIKDIKEMEINNIGSLILPLEVSNNKILILLQDTEIIMKEKDTMLKCLYDIYNELVLLQKYYNDDLFEFKDYLHSIINKKQLNAILNRMKFLIAITEDKSSPFTELNKNILLKTIKYCIEEICNEIKDERKMEELLNTDLIPTFKKSTLITEIG